MSDANQYKPWDETGQTELQYYHERYLEAQKRIAELESACDAYDSTLGGMTQDYEREKARAEKAEAARDAAIKEIGVQARARGLTESANSELREVLQECYETLATGSYHNAPCCAKAKAALNFEGVE